ncbi:hypothetical protein HYR99_04415 [Candidatus Poribacteria bacterium]|nr:hypothetical protein [Candidatus Poribacteria bacterium]
MVRLGIGLIPQSGYRLREAYRDDDAARLFNVESVTTEESAVCISGLILRGLKKPHPLRCPAFGTDCTPEHPLVATMVSAEGACAAYYRYGRCKWANEQSSICRFADLLICLF